MSKAELQAELRRIRKENFMGGNAVSAMNMAALRTELQAHKAVMDRAKSHPSLERTKGPAAPRPFHEKAVVDADENGEGIQVPVIREKKKPVEKVASQVRVLSEEQKAKMGEARARAQKAKRDEKKEAKALIKEPEGPSRSAPKKICFCDCPSCPDKH